MEYLWIFYISVIFVGALTAQELELAPSGPEIVASIDTDRTLTCRTPPEFRLVNANLRWYDKDNKEVQAITGRVYIERPDEQSIKLYITSIVNSDAGTYTCKGTVEGNPLQKSVTLTLYKDITFDNAPPSQNPVEFTNAIIICRVSGQPSPTVSWKYRGKRIQTGGRYEIDLFEGLKIQNITEEDNGLYECRAEVEADGRMKRREISVVVHKTPKITRQMGTVVGVEGQQVAIECKASGKPAPQYEFYRFDNKTNTPPVLVSETDQRRIDVNSGVINFLSLYRDDQSSYICRAINSAGQVDSVGYLDVQIKPKIYDYRNVTQEEGKDRTLVCLSEGEPEPEMKFKKVGNARPYELGENENGKITVVSPQSGRLEMTVTNLVPEDSANYTCTSRNSAAFAEKNATLIVQYSPRFVADQQREFYSWPGKTRNMTCMTYAEPEPVINWYHNGRIIETNETFRVIPLKKNSVLQVKVGEADQLWIYNEYECRARNNYGTNSLSLQLKRAMMPDPPKNVTAVEVTPTTVKMLVEPPDNDGGMPVSGYRVDFNSIVNSFRPDEPILIENLRPSTQYVFSIRARNEVDVSQPRRIEIETKAVSRPYPLVIISQSDGLYPYDYTVKWDKPETGGNSIKEYNFRTRRVEVDPNTLAVIKPIDDNWNNQQVREENIDSPMQSYTLKGLKPGSYYELEVKARNDLDWSSPTKRFVFHTAKENYGPSIGGGMVLSPSRGLLVLSTLILVSGTTCW